MAVYLLIIIGQLAYAIHGNPPTLKSNSYGFDYMFNSVQPEGVEETMAGNIAVYLLLPIVGSDLAIYIKNNHELYSVIGRTGWKKFFQKSLSYAFIGAADLYWLGCLLEVLIISIFYRQFVYMPRAEIMLMRGDGYFSLNNLANLLIKVLLFGIGWGIYAAFIFAVALFIKKTSLCLFLGPVVGYLIFLQENLSIDVGETFSNISNIWDIVNLTNPLERWVGENQFPAIYYLNYVTTAVFYIVLTAVLLRLWYVKNVERG